MEFALVTAALLAVVVGMGTMGHKLQDGTFASHAMASASHMVEGAEPGALADVFAY